MGRFELLKEQLNTLCPQLDVRVDEPLERHTSFHIGGPAALMALPATREEAVLCVQTAEKLGIEPFFMGNGSNLLASDEGVERFIVKSTNLRHCEVQGTTVTADSGVTLARLAVFAREQGQGRVKLSLRAVAPNRVSGVAQHFGGGGHAQAAGASVQLPLDEAIAQTVARMAEELESNA